MQISSIIKFMNEEIRSCFGYIRDFRYNISLVSMEDGTHLKIEHHGILNNNLRDEGTTQWTCSVKVTNSEPTGGKFESNFNIKSDYIAEIAFLKYIDGLSEEASEQFNLYLKKLNIGREEGKV